MIRLFHRLARNSSGAAAAEMALVTPLLLIIMFGSVELGNYFMNEHSLVKAVRDGARFAARQSFTSYPDCSTVGTSAQDATKNVVMYGYLSGSAADGVRLDLGACTHNYTDLHAYDFSALGVVSPKCSSW